MIIIFNRAQNSEVVYLFYGSYEGMNIIITLRDESIISNLYIIIIMYYL